MEFLLHALAGCIATTFVLHATARGIAIHEMSTELEGDIDLHGLLGLDEDVPPGYREIRVRVNVRADCSEEALAVLLAYAQAHSPVCNTISVGVRLKSANSTIPDILDGHPGYTADRR